MTERTFTDIMKNPQDGMEEVVWADLHRRVLVWHKKGVPTDVICKALTRLALGTIYLTGDHPREWRYNALYVIERATYHKNWCESVARREVPVTPFPDFKPLNRISKQAEENR